MSSCLLHDLLLHLLGQLLEAALEVARQRLLLVKHALVVGLLLFDGRLHGCLRRLGGFRAHLVLRLLCARSGAKVAEPGQQANCQTTAFKPRKTAPGPSSPSCTTPE